MSSSIPKSLLQFIDLSRVECLNQSLEHPIASVLKDEPSTDGSFLESDTDEQLIIHIPFRQIVKIHSLVIKAPEEGSGPQRVKLFVNHPTVDFSEAAESNGTQILDLDSETVKNGHPVSLRYVKFQNVSCLSLFVETNQEDSEKTRIQWIQILGQSGEVMDLAKIKEMQQQDSLA